MPRTFSAEREAEIRLGFSVLSSRDEHLIITELDAERAAHQETQNECAAHRKALSGFLTTVNPTGYEDGVKAEEAFEQALACVVADREVRRELELAKSFQYNYEHALKNIKFIIKLEREEAAEKLAETQALVRELVEALEQANFVMNHLGDQLNEMDCVAEIEEESGIPQEKVDAAYYAVRNTLAKAKGVLPAAPVSGECQ